MALVQGGWRASSDSDCPSCPELPYKAACCFLQLQCLISKPAERDQTKKH